MAEAVRGYPRWEGELSRAPRMFIIAFREVQRIWDNQWARSALMLAFAYAVITVGNLYAARDRPGVHTMETYREFLEFLTWAGLAIAGIASGPALLEDAQRGALELYHSRAVRSWDYLAGKGLAVVVVTTVAVAGPALLYWGGSWLAFDEHPDGWTTAWIGGIGHGVLWGLVVAGLGLGLSCLSKSSRAATLTLIGGVLILDVLFGRVMTGITRAPEILLFSPSADMAQQSTWLLGMEPAYAFPWWWALAALGGLAAAGWGAVWWKRPRVKGAQ